MCEKKKLQKTSEHMKNKAKAKAYIWSVIKTKPGDFINISTLLIQNLRNQNNKKKDLCHKFSL